MSIEFPTFPNLLDIYLLLREKYTNLLLSEIKYKCFDDGESISDVCVDSVMNQKQTHTNLLHKQQRNLDKKGTKPWL